MHLILSNDIKIRNTSIYVLLELLIQSTKRGVSRDNMSDMLPVATIDFCASLYGLHKPSNNHKKTAVRGPQLADQTYTNKLNHSHF